MVDLMFAVVDPTLRVPPNGPTLLRSANLVISGDARWERGLRYTPDACGAHDTAMLAGDCDTGFAGFPDGDDFPLGDTVDYRPLFVAVAQECSAIGGQPAIDLTEERAIRLLNLSETAGIARELWRGDIAASPATDLPNNYLGKSPTQILSGVTTRLLKAFAELEQNLAECSVAGGNTIHVAPRVVPYLAYLQVVTSAPDGRLFTKQGTVVIADPGYDGSGPAHGTPDATGATSWMYGTGPVDVRRGLSAVMLDRNGIRARNDFTVYGYRPFAATFDPCCHLAVKADLATLI